jgi:glutathione synthase/RimK-type ligase-like ATP-grasp enzyme
MKYQARVAILSNKDDLHALTVKKAFDAYEDITCDIIETNSISSKSNLSWSNLDDLDFRGRIANQDGEIVDVDNLDVIWWRRFNSNQLLPDYVTDPIHIDLINNDCKTTVLGLLLNDFSGTWINEPLATNLAENKLVQLKAAQKAGFKVPRTLVSQEPKIIRHFCEMLEYKVVVKPVKGSLGVPLFTNMLSEEHLASDESLSLSPTIYQEFIPGEKHIRIHCFGDAIHAVLIESQQLDWRQNLDIPFSIFDIDENTKFCIKEVLKILRLKMGVFDFKLTNKGDIIWLEVNPQGQFLFAEGLSGFDLTSAFVEFIYQEAKHAFSCKSLSSCNDPQSYRY